MCIRDRKTQGVETRLVDRAMYMRMPMLADLAGGGKPWLKISLDAMGAESGVNVDDLLKQSQQMDPLQLTKKLKASKDVREVGKETVNGVETTHYTGTYRMDDAIALLPPDQQKAYRNGAGQAGTAPMTFDLWVDEEQLPRQLSVKGKEGAETMTTTIKLREFGDPVQITAPPAGQVTDVQEMMKTGIRGAAGTPGA